MTEQLENTKPERDPQKNWDRIMGLVLAIPGVRVDREHFLRTQLSSYCDAEQVTNAVEERPAKAGISLDTIDHIANSCIKRHTLKSSSIAFVTGVPGGWLMLGTVPADLAQFYYHALVLAQKLAYLYGWPEILNEEEIDDETKMRVTLLIGAMMGADGARVAIKKLATEYSTKAIINHLKYVALKKTIYYPTIKQIGKYIGVKVTRDLLIRWAAKVVPVIGGVTSGLLTMAMMRPMAKRLQAHLKTLKFAQP